ncbi:MAG: cytochrome c biogenesis protein [Bdellovibrionales bacterium]
MVRLILLFAISIIFAVVVSGHAQATKSPKDFNYASFNNMPILDNGRIKPLGAFAKTRLKDFHGDDKNATQWLAETLFNPSDAINAKIFFIKDDNLKRKLLVDPSKDYFTIDDLQNGLQATQDDIIQYLQVQQDELSTQQKALLKIHEDVISYNELLRSFSLLLALDSDETFINLLPQEQRIISDLKSIIATKGEDINTYNEDEQKTALIGFQLQQIRAGGLGNDDLKVLPITLNNEKAWVSPWQTINEGRGSPQTKQLLELWAKAANAYRNNDTKIWQSATQQLLQSSLENAPNALSKTRLKAELFYQTIKPYHVTMVLYAFGLFTTILLLFKPSKPLNWATTLILSSATLCHISAIAARIYILDRPPVGTLYESVLFVSLICAIIALIAFIKTNKSIFALTGQIAALGLLAVAPSMLQNNDSLELLVAVLNTNFWLATHVLCITAGYGVCIIAACLAHAYLLLRLKNPQHLLLEGLFQSIHKTGLVALLLTSVGTVLGGIWADQSWGRFWGWDPKENGALLIVLWIIWIQHGRLSGHIRPLAYAAGIAALNIVVAIAWFGVNLLGVGLHSYGFTSGIANGLILFCSIEIIIILGLWATIRIKHKKQEIPS